MSDRPTPAVRRLRLLLAAGAAVAAVSACAPASPPTTPATTSAATPTGSAPSSGGPVITAFQVIDDVSCAGSSVAVPVSWATRDAQTVKIEVDRQPLSSAPSYPLDGVARIGLPCDGKEHELVLVADGAGRQVAVSRQVNTLPAPPVNGPSITRFDLLDDITCTGSTVEVPAAWLTQNAQAVNFSVDGQPLPAAAGFPVTGVGNIQVPCDGKAHKVTLTATGEGQSAALSRSVNTAASSSGGGGTTTTVAPTTPPTLLTGVTEAPPTSR